MAEVIDLAAARKAARPHWEGKCICLGCRHEWRQTGELGVVDGLLCPECKLPKGVCKNLFGAQPEDAVLLCKCGSEALTAYRRKEDNLLRVTCMACGTNLTDAFFEG